MIRILLSLFLSLRSLLFALAMPFVQLQPQLLKPAVFLAPKAVLPKELELSDVQFKGIQTKMQRFEADFRNKNNNKPPTQMQREEHLFQLIRKDGGLGIKYEWSKDRMPKTPDQVLRDRRGDCDEMSLLFVAAVKRFVEAERQAGVKNPTWDMNRYSVLTLTTQAEGKELMHVVVLSESWANKVVYDPSAFDVGKPITDISIASLNKLGYTDPVIKRERFEGISGFAAHYPFKPFYFYYRV